MKKQIACTLASFMAITSVVAPTSFVSAKTVLREETQLSNKQENKEEIIEIKTYQDFIQNFQCVKKTYEKAQKPSSNKIQLDKSIQNEKPIIFKTIVEDENTIVYEWITKVDQTNFSIVLQGKKIYDTLQPELQKTISDEILRVTKKEYQSFVDDAIKEEEIFKENQEQKVPVEEVVKPEEDFDSLMGVVPEEHTENVPDGTESEEDASEKIEDIQPDASEQEQSPIKPDVFMAVIPAVEINQPKVESQQNVEPQQKVEENVLLETPVASAEFNMEMKKENKNATVQGFIDTYLTASDGTIYSIANTLNYKQILGAMPAWTKLTSAQRAGVNSILNKKIGKSYNKLVQEAQSIELNKGSVVTPSIHTSTENHAGLYGALTGLSVAMFGWLLKKHTEKE